MPDRILEQQDLQRLGAIEAEVAAIGEGGQLSRQVEIRTRIEDVNARIDEVRLPFLLVAAQAWQQAGRVREIDAGAGQHNALANPKS